jgi:replicative DNA helicase
MKITCGIDLVLVDSVQFMADDMLRLIPVEKTLEKLKGIAEVLRIPVVAIYPMNKRVKGRESEQARKEMMEMAVISKIVDNIVLMSGTTDKLVFNQQKTTNAEPVRRSSFLDWSKHN